MSVNSRIGNHSVPHTELNPYEGSLIKCHQCNSTEVVGICHVCGRLVCSEHESKPTIVQNYKKEFAPALSPGHIKGAHCSEHPHFLNSPLKMLILPIVILVFIGVRYGILHGTTLYQFVYSDLELTTPELTSIIISFALALLSLGAGIFLIVIAIQRYVKEYLPQSEGEPLAAVPIVPEQYALSLFERAHLRMEISEQSDTYAEIDSVKGELSVHALVPQDVRQRVQAHYQKYERNGWPRPSQFNFGFVTTDNLNLIDVPTTERMPSSPNVIPLKSTAVNFSALRYGTGWHELFKTTYYIKKDALNFGEDGHTPREMPVWFKPVLTPRSSGQTLQLRFDFAKELSGNKRLREFRLIIPFDAFGDRNLKSPIRSTNGRFYADRWIVEWVNWSLEDSHQMLRVPEVTFSLPITEMGVPLKATFDIEIEDTTLSGIDVKYENIWLPNGKLIPSSESGVTLDQTVILTADAFINPAAYSYRYEFSRSTSSRLNGIQLTSKAIEKVVRTLQVNDVHVKSVTQNPAVVRPSAAGAESHGWDVLGRWYKEIYPVDVHVFLAERRSQEEESGNSVIDLEITLRVQVNTKNPEFEQYAESHCERLSNQLVQALKQ